MSDKSEHGIPTRAEVIAAHTLDTITHIGDGNGTDEVLLDCTCGAEIQGVLSPDAETTVGAIQMLMSPHVADKLREADREARTITSVEALDALPFETVVRDAIDDVYEQWGNKTEDEPFEWKPVGDDLPGDPLVPVRVLYLPGEDEE